MLALELHERALDCDSPTLELLHALSLSRAWDSGKQRQWRAVGQFTVIRLTGWDESGRESAKLLHALLSPV
jgi:hypothetical protein